MCKFASFVLTKEKCLWLPDSESHSEIIRRFEINESGARGLNVVKVEILPPDDGDWADLTKWKLMFDQDQFPEWHSAIESRDRAARHLQKKLNEVTRLYVSGATGLKSLPELPNVRHLDVSGATGLKSLPELPNARTLDASGATGLKSLPELPNVTTLRVSGATGLKSLPELPKCEYLYVSGATGLKSLPELPNVRHLDVSGATGLKSLPDELKKRGVVVIR